MEENQTATLTFNKNVDDIEQPELMPEDWYVMELRDAPEVKPNKAMQNDPESEKAGKNWVVPLVVATGDEEFDGRWFTLFLPLPKPGDDKKRTPMGQTVEDQAMERIGQFVEAFGGNIQGDTVSVKKGMRGQCYVDRQVLNGEPRNGINMFAGFKPADAGMAAIG